MAAKEAADGDNARNILQKQFNCTMVSDLSCLWGNKPAPALRGDSVTAYGDNPS